MVKKGDSSAPSGPQNDKTGWILRRGFLSDSLLGILSIVVWLATLVVAILVLIKLFQNEGVGKGILGLICLLYTFVWGWMKNKELGIRNIMIAWTALIVVAIILNAIAGM